MPNCNTFLPTLNDVSQYNARERRREYAGNACWTPCFLKRGDSMGHPREEFVPYGDWSATEFSFEDVG
ncbi:hypothetical protein CEXT_674401 [Caerostris extrusa]|uniref:Uncharacterized protein n=1 Tax=Caerostris extrusa TaxID=172846 RepID=A0AAV4QZD2_CAEEX|nr:hypothetical protein CEXT_674401 [Caerostris extrusa]